MILNRPRSPAHIPGKPRASGDDPAVDYGPDYLDGVNPARAGMIPPPGAPWEPSAGKPRASGDDP